MLQYTPCSESRVPQCQCAAPPHSATVCDSAAPATHVQVVNGDADSNRRYRDEPERRRTIFAQAPAQHHWLRVLPLSLYSTISTADTSSSFRPRKSAMWTRPASSDAANARTFSARVPLFGRVSRTVTKWLQLSINAPTAYNQLDVSLTAGFPHRPLMVDGATSRRRRRKPIFCSGRCDV
jgi:hypothetical protein